MSKAHTRTALLATAVVVVGCSAAERNEDGELAVAGSLDAFAIEIGDCYDDEVQISGQVSDVPGVPCAEPHDNEVFATFELTEGGWPGDERVIELANDGCFDRFEPYVGATYEESVLMITTLTPSERSWSQVNDREVVCVAYHMDLDKLEGSVRGTGM